MENDEFIGKVTRVYDGDTLDILEDNGHTNRIRLASIDTPELAQEYGHQAKALLEHLCLHKMVRVKVQDVDKYNRLVAHVYIPGADVGDIENCDPDTTLFDADATANKGDIAGNVYNRDLAELMLMSGAAWHLSYFDRDDPDYDLHKELEQKARALKLGLWQNLTPVPPWVWRRNHPRE